MAGDGEDSTPQLRRYLAALLRHKWIILAVTAVGSIGGIVGSRFVNPEYEAQSTLWVEVTSRDAAQAGPIRSEELLQSAGWIDLLRSYVVLDYVVNEQRLYVETSPVDRNLFQTFSLQQQFLPGEFRLEVVSATEYVLSHQGAEIERGSVSGPIGSRVGFDWRPPADRLTPGRVVEFTVRTPRDVAVELATSVQANLSSQGNFLRLSLTGQDPVHTTRTINALSDRYVAVAAELKRDRLDQLTAVLDEQRRYAEDNLRTAELQLESFKVETVTLPSDPGTPVAPGLTITQDPVMSRFFEMKVESEQLRTDREAIERIINGAGSAGITLDGLALIPSVQSSSALMQALEERMQLRAEIRALLLTYTELHPQVDSLQTRINNLEQVTIPQLAGQLANQLRTAELDLETRIGSASTELRQIPPRAIEEARLERQVAIAEDLHSTLKQRYEEARLAAVSTIPDIRILDEAVVPTQPTKDNRAMVMIMGFLGSLGLAIAGVILADRFDPRVRYPEEITRGMGLPILGVVPNIKRMGSEGAREATAHAAEAFREIRLNLLNAHGTAGTPMITITSPSSGDGKSFVTSNLSLALADLGLRTVIIDGDIRRGGLHHTLGATRVPGLTDYLAGHALLGEVLQGTRYPNVFLIASGTRLANGPELLSSPAMGELVLKLKSRFGAVVLDSPPLGAGVDALVLGALTRNLLLVLRTGATDRALATAKLETLDRLPIRLLGAILNGTPNSSAYKYYSYLPGYEVPVEEAVVTELQGSET